MEWSGVDRSGVERRGVLAWHTSLLFSNSSLILLFTSVPYHTIFFCAYCSITVSLSVPMSTSSCQLLCLWCGYSLLSLTFVKLFEDIDSKLSSLPSLLSNLPSGMRTSRLKQGKRASRGGNEFSSNHRHRYSLSAAVLVPSVDGTLITT